MKTVKIAPLQSTECPECSCIDVSCDECHMQFDAGEFVFCDDADMDEPKHYHKKCIDDDKLPPLTRAMNHNWRKN